MLRETPSARDENFGVGCLVGPWGLDLLRLEIATADGWLEHVTELGVTLSLFIGGLRLRLPPLHRAWRAAYRLASAALALANKKARSMSALVDPTRLLGIGSKQRQKEPRS